MPCSVSLYRNLYLPSASVYTTMETNLRPIRRFPDVHVNLALAAHVASYVVRVVAPMLHLREARCPDIPSILSGFPLPRMS